MFDSHKSILPKILIPVLAGIALLFIPLVGDFHFESALLASLSGCFWAGYKGAQNENLRSDFYEALWIGFYLFLAATPLLIKALITGCFSIHGLGFWLIFPLPSVFFGFALGRLFREWKLPFARSITVMVLAIIAIGFFIYELLTYPQVYFFNHVWGGWPGPIYDEAVVVTDAAVFFRMLTVLWAIFIWHLPTMSKDKYSAWIVVLSCFSMALFYPQMPEMGVVAPPAHIQAELGGHKSTKHFELYYDQNRYSTDEINRITKEHEFYFSQITDELQLSYPDGHKIESYLYGHPWQKKQLVGAKFTSYVPIWLQQDQLHIAKQQLETSLKHELVHVLAKQFGNDLFNGSWSIGLIEGIAVAVDGGSSSTSTIDQIVVSEKPYPSAKQLEQSFSFEGFYSGRSGVNYITSGSFVRFLMDNYPVKNLKRAYSTGSVEKAYKKDWMALTQEWHHQLDSVQVDSLDEQAAARIFSYPSLFEKKCPHVVSSFMEDWDQYRHALAVKDTARALKYIDEAVAVGDSVPPVKTEWSFRHLENGDFKLVQQVSSLQDTTVELQLLYADANMAIGDTIRARKHLKKGKALFVQEPDSLLGAALAVRMDQRQWELYRRMRYKNQLPDSAIISQMYYRSKIRSLQKAIVHERWPLLIVYAHELLRHPVQRRYFDAYQLLIHRLAFLGEGRLAKSLIKKIKALELRERYKERLSTEKNWITFLESS